MNWDIKMMEDQTGKVVIITGSNTGIGYHMAHGLVSKGASVVKACRNLKKASDSRNKILKDFPKANIKIYQLDLADLDNIKYFANKFINENDKLDVLINNAGVMIPPYSKTKNNFELQFGTNHLGHFALTGLLLPLLEKNDNGRIITVSSIAHNPGIIDFQDAVIGPVTYDLVSLLKDCYHRLSFEQVSLWVDLHRKRLISVGCLDKTISKETLMPLGMVIALCGGVVWISNQLSLIHNKLELLESSLEEQWTKRDMENWGLKLKLENPDIQIPSIDN